MSQLNRTLAPPIINVEQIPVTRPQVFTSANGIQVYGFHQDDYDIFKLELVFPDAGYVSPGIKKGIASTTNALLLSGTASQTAYQINDALDFYGAYIQRSCDYYSASLTLFGNKRYFRETVDLLFKAVEGVTFNEEELALNKSRRISSLQVNKQKTAFLSSITFGEEIFGSSHPAGAFVDEPDIEAINASDLRDFYNKSYKSLLLILSGNISSEMKDALAESLSGTGFQASADNMLHVEPVPAATVKKDVFIQKDNMVQASLCMGKLLPSRKDPDYLKLVLCNMVLGGYFGSRLMKNIREDKGLTYGIGSSISAYRSYSVFKIRCDFRNEAVAEVLKETAYEIGRLCTELLSDEELDLAKNYLIGNFQRSFDGALAQSERFKLLLELDSTYEYYESYIQKIRQISPEEIKNTAYNYLNDNAFIEVVAGSK